MDNENETSREVKYKENKSNYELNSKLQQKKNKLRTLLKEKGILIKGAKNDFDNYAYFSEGQYKELFTELFSQCGLELDSNEINVQNIDGTDKQKYGVFITIEFILTDIDTGYSVSYTHSGIAFDKGDKALYKAKTGALKYFFATTFLVATKDDPERNDNSINKPKQITNNERLASAVQIKVIQEKYQNNKKELSELLSSFNKKSVSELSIAEASKIITNMKRGNN